MKVATLGRKKLLCSIIGATVLGMSFGAAQAASYTSTPLVNDLFGRSCGVCGTDGDNSYAPMGPDDSGWLPFSPSPANPIPAKLLSIDPSFSTKYQVDSLTFSIKAGPASSPDGGGTHAWDFVVGDGLDGPTDTFHLQLTNLQVETFTSTPASQSFLRALDGGLKIRLVETTAGVDHLSLFNYKVYVNYSDLAPAVPEPSEWMMLVAGLAVMGFIVRRRKQR